MKELKNKELLDLYNKITSFIKDLESKKLEVSNDKQSK